jgi:hypothetical protein
LSSQKTKSIERESSSSTVAQSSPPEVTDRLAGLLPGEELEKALQGLEPEQIMGPGGVLTQLAGRVIETALGAELTEHLGYPPGQAPPGGAGNHRNGATAKTVQTELGPVEIRTPRDRDGSFDPRLVAKRQTRLAGLDDRILGLYAGGMSVRDIESHLTDLYGVQIKRDTISRVTDAVLADVEAWRARPLEAVYPIVYFDALMVKIREDRSVRSRACYLAIGVSVEGEREVLGIWWQETEGAKFWLAVLNDLHHRGVAAATTCCATTACDSANRRISTFPRCLPTPTASSSTPYIAASRSTPTSPGALSERSAGSSSRGATPRRSRSIYASPPFARASRSCSTRAARRSCAASSPRCLTMTTRAGRIAPGLIRDASLRPT